ncbi:MAG TPA: 2,3-bisphosphoglycerate-independent phosphoglycerate mutase [Candidatus Pacearchaeota archaeon]|nr:2,3-bisphosphoglycerate-independent phosphoglycerate mutase [Candidatus Pacearchaeota archaeon]HPO75367.1 2,3-bisphosphoglycerate-independent phosphoglycerate mutase [Candidatus Pacearchaeota archaeon]
MQNVILIILDGWGMINEKRGNAILNAKTPNFNYYWNHFPKTQLYAHGRYVGLPDNQDGNSEAGHLNLGAGRVVVQDSVYISESIKDGTFFKNTAFLEAIKHLKKYNTKLHLIGLLSGDESPHMSPEHLYALLDLARREGIQKIILHLFTDGRDSSQHGAPKFLKTLREHFKDHQTFFEIGSVIGRAFAMDRKKNWQNIEKTYNLLTLGEGEKVESAEEAISRAYNKGLTDEFIPPSVVINNRKLVGTIDDNDVIIFFNLRSDRARELTKAFVQPDFEEKNPGAFKRKKIPQNIRFVAMTDFGPDLPNILTAFPSRDIKNSLPFVLGNFSQLYIAESEKYAHVTFFFNGGYADPVVGEERIRIPSPPILHYNEKPEMSAPKLTKVVIEKLNSRKYNFICMNFANPDMIGHTGDFKAGIKACEAVDRCLGEIVENAFKNDFVSIITADHGNIEEMINLETGEVDTNHSKNPVPFILVNPALENKNTKLQSGGRLANVAPTVLKLMNIQKPKEMDKKSLI